MYRIADWHKTTSLDKKEVSRESSLPKDLLAFLPPLYNERANELAEDNKKEHKMSRCR